MTVTYMGSDIYEVVLLHDNFYITKKQAVELLEEIVKIDNGGGAMELLLKSMFGEMT